MDEYREKRFAELEAAYSGGDKGALPWAILQALELSSAPVWVRTALLEGLSRVHTKRAISWDEVLGKPHPSGAHRERGKYTHSEQAARAWIWVKHLQGQGMPIDEAFQRTAEETAFGSAGTIRDLYYSIEKRDGPKPLPDTYERLGKPVPNIR